VLKSALLHRDGSCARYYAPFVTFLSMRRGG
jgi:hypothetical protein